MTRHRNKNGRFVSGADGDRIKSRSFRATEKTSEQLSKLSEQTGETLADLVARWADDESSSANSDLDLEEKLSQTLKEYKAKYRVGEQSASYKHAKAAMRMLMQNLCNKWESM